MKFNKANIISSIFITICILLLFLLLFLPKIIDLIPSKDTRFIIYIILFILFFIHIIFETYHDIRKKQFTTKIYIVITDIIAIIAFTVLFYINFTNHNETNIEVVLQKSTYSMMALLFFAGAILIQTLLKNQRFKK